jgi:hypothetical protein
MSIGLNESKPDFAGQVELIDDLMEKVRRMINKYGEADPELREGPAMGDLPALDKHYSRAIGALLDADLDAEARRRAHIRAMENGVKTLENGARKLSRITGLGSH